VLPVLYVAWFSRQKLEDQLAKPSGAS